ncbi:probable glutathione S-transferase 6 [Dendronephthya gigantea]|uniref:probable glutathione S-transferase 6 n=1 Tax=Dendronephthya gigantea TaxID=151771 RepID=UPI00106A2C3D|nr:probable glutathione S-transferase 6 [Dendronephthya gigantea]
MLKLAGVEFTEVLYDWGSQQWADAKKDISTYAFGAMPVLEVDGTPISQSMAILRYLGKELGYAPSENLQQAKADAIVDECQDIVGKYLWKYLSEKEPERKEREKKNWFESILPREIEYFESILKRNGTGCLVGSKITYADIAFFCTFNDYVAGGKADVPSQFQNIPMATALYQRILNEPNVAAHIKSKPATFV